MTVLLADGFNRTGANLGANPAGRWNLPAPGAGTNDWTLDGQSAKSTAVTSSTRGWARFISPDAGVKYGEVRARLRRSSSSIDVSGLVMHADRSTMADVTRLAFVHVNTASRYELRHYTAYDTATTIAYVTEATVGLTMDTTDRPWRFRVQQLGASTSTTLKLSGWISGIPIFVDVVWPDFLASADTNNRAPGFEVKHTTAGSSSVYLAVDEFEFDDLATPVTYAAPSLDAEDPLAATTMADEGTASGSTPVTPDFGELITEKYFVNRTETEAGYQVTWSRFQHKRRLWRVHHNSLTASELTTLRAFFASHVAGVTPWTYDTPEGGTAAVCLIDGTLEVERIPSGSGAPVYRVAYSIEEVY